MKYMLMMHTPGKGPYAINKWPAEALQAHIRFMIDFNRKLIEGGEMVSCEGLSGPDQATRVRAGADGAPITDGVFPEAKEFLAGYWIIDVESPERAFALAAQISLAPGADGAPLHMDLEVRQIMTLPSQDQP